MASELERAVQRALNDLLRPVVPDLVALRDLGGLAGEAVEAFLATLGNLPADLIAVAVQASRTGTLTPDGTDTLLLSQVFGAGTAEILTDASLHPLTLTRAASLATLGYVVETLSGADLGLPAGYSREVGRLGITGDFFRGDLTPYDSLIDIGPEIAIALKKDAAGNVLQLMLFFNGLSDAGDLPEVLAVPGGETVGNYLPAIALARQLAETLGLGGEDVFISGVSMGGAAVNSFFDLRDRIADGFFAGSTFVGVAAPFIAETAGGGAGRLFNFGAENDPVYQLAGQGNAFLTLLGLEDRLAPAALRAMDNVSVVTQWNLDNEGIRYGLLDGDAWAPHTEFAGLRDIVTSAFFGEIRLDDNIVLSGFDFARSGQTLVELRDFRHTTNTDFGAAATFIGRDAWEKVTGSRACDRIDAGGGNDQISARSGDDRVFAGSGDDQVDGGAGADRINDGSGSDLISGGAGADVFVLVADGTLDRLRDFAVGSDRITLTGSGFDSLSIRDTGNGNVAIRDGSGDVLVLIDRDGGLSAAGLAADDFLFT